MGWIVFLALLIFIMMATIGAMNLIGNINEKLCSINSKQKKVVLNSFLRKIVPQRDLSISDYYRPPKKEKEAYLLTVILTIIDIILGISFSIVAIFVKIFTELNCIIFLFGIVAYAIILLLIMFVLYIIECKKK